MRQDAGGWTLATAWSALRKFWILVAATTIVGGAIGFGSAALTTPQYQSTASLYFALNQGNSASDLNQGSTYTQSQMLSFAQLATSSRVLEQVIDDLDLDMTPKELARGVAITIPQDTAILKVQVTSPSAERAAEIANAVSKSLTEVVGEVAPKGAQGAATITASVIDDAVVPEFQALPNKTRDAALGLMLGLVAGVLGAFALTLADTRVRNERALLRVTDAPLLGTIARTPRGAETGLAVLRDPHGHVAEDFRRIQSALAFSTLDAGSRIILVTSAAPGEGKSTFSANLAVTLADLGENTLLIDADLRRPRVGEVFGIDPSVGLTTVVRGTIGLEDAVLEWHEDGPELLTSGEVPPNSAAILTSHVFEDVLKRSAETHDVVIVDSPPVLTVADTNLLAPLVDGVVIVVDSSKTQRAQLAETIRTLEGAGAHILGVVLNKVRLERGRRTYYTQPTHE